MNKLGVHALVWAGDLSPESTRKVLSSTKAAGFDVAELSLHGPKVMDLALTRDLCRSMSWRLAAREA